MGRIVRPADAPRDLSLALTDSRIRWTFPFLLLVAWLVYHPALNRVFTADQVWYFAELHGQTSLLEGLRLVDYSAARQYWKGDESLFRPLLFLWLAVENALFSYHHVWWNIANLFLHSLVAFFLLRVLVAIRRTWWAVAAAVLFVVLKPPVELVVWNHLGGYLLACLFLAIGLRAFVQGAVPTFAWSFTVAGLFYETMVPISLVAAALMMGRKRIRGEHIRRGEIILLLCPALVFFGLYLIHLQYVSRFLYVDNPDAATISVLARAAVNLANAGRAAVAWTMEFAFPSWLSIVPAVFDRFQAIFRPDLKSLEGTLNIALVATAFIVAAASVSRAHVQKHAGLLLLLAGSLLLYGFVICLGRPLSLVLSSGYYPYFPCVLLTIFAFAAIDFDRLTGWKAGLGGLVLAAAVALQAAGAYAVARETGRLNNNPSRLLVRVSRFVDAHKGEADFTFTIRAHLQNLDPRIALRRGYPDDSSAPVEARHLTEIVFSRYYDDAAPKYVFEQSER
jgi:hypothetical protein